jgi:hypothetical protein
MTGKHRKTTAVVKNPVQSAPRHKDTRVEVDAPSRANRRRELSIADLMACAVPPRHIREMGRA